jgi:fructokinase
MVDISVVRNEKRDKRRHELLYGGIEGGGTKFVCAVASDPGNIVAETRFATTTPGETLEQVCEFFLPYVRAQQIEAIGLGSFGPVDIEPGSPMYGYITTTPKPNWSNTNILGYLQERLNLPIVMNMDVAAAAMGEFQWGASKGCDPSLYLTVGTGIGGGYIKGGKPLRGLVSPEMGHIRIPHDKQADTFSGVCPYHGDCFEGLASGPAIQARMGQRAENLSPDNPFWDLEADYIAYALANFIFTFAPRKIVLGGGVMQQRFLYASIRAKVDKLLNRYLQNEMLVNRLDEYIVPPLLGNRSGVLGAIALAINFVAS